MFYVIVSLSSNDTKLYRHKIHNIYIYVLDIRLLVAASDRVVLMDENGTNFEVISKIDTYDIQNIAYHETKNYIYWSSWNGNITRFVSKYS